MKEGGDEDATEMAQQAQPEGDNSDRPIERLNIVIPPKPYTGLGSADNSLDRKRSRRTMAVDDGALDDILGQSKDPLCFAAFPTHVELILDPPSLLLLSSVTSKLTSLSTKESLEESVLAFIDVLKCSTEEARFYLESSAGCVETAVMLWLENNPRPLPVMPNAHGSYAYRGNDFNYGRRGRGDALGGGVGGNMGMGMDMGMDMGMGMGMGPYAMSGMQDMQDMQGMQGLGLPRTQDPNTPADVGLGYYTTSDSGMGIDAGTHRPIPPHLRAHPPFKNRAVEINDLPSGWGARISAYSGYIYFVHESGVTQLRVPPGYADSNPNGEGNGCLPAVEEDSEGGAGAEAGAETEAEEVGMVADEGETEANSAGQGEFGTEQLSGFDVDM
jgi:hypothetical protein